MLSPAPVRACKGQPSAMRGHASRGSAPPPQSSGVGYDKLGELLAAIGKNTRPDSPVYSSIQNLQAPTKKTSQGSTGKARKASANLAGSVAEARATDSTDSYAALWKDAMAAKDQGDWSKARAILQDIYQAQTKSATGDAAKAKTQIARVRELHAAPKQGGN